MFLSLLPHQWFWPLYSWQYDHRIIQWSNPSYCQCMKTLIYSKYNTLSLQGLYFLTVNSKAVTLYGGIVQVRRWQPLTFWKGQGLASAPVAARKTTHRLICQTRGALGSFWHTTEGSVRGMSHRVTDTQTCTLLSQSHPCSYLYGESWLLWHDKSTKPRGGALC